MPPVSTIKTFIESLQTGQTSTTKALTKLCAERGADDVKPHLGELANPHVLDTLPKWVDDALRARGLGDTEIQHINDWPSAPKDHVRAALDRAVKDNRPVEFHWELHSGTDSTNKIENLDGPAGAPIRVTFQSPQKNVRVSSPLLPTLGEIKVDV